MPHALGGAASAPTRAFSQGRRVGVCALMPVRANAVKTGRVPQQSALLVSAVRTVPDAPPPNPASRPSAHALWALRRRAHLVLQDAHQG